MRSIDKKPRRGSGGETITLAVLSVVEYQIGSAALHAHVCQKGQELPGSQVHVGQLYGCGLKIELKVGELDLDQDRYVQSGNDLTRAPFLDL